MTTGEALAGAIWGLLVGDAAGVPYEFREPSQIGEFRFGAQGPGPAIDRRWAHGVPAGTWSDDGALALALLDSLLGPGPDGRVPSFDLADQGRRFRAWYEGGAYTPDGVCFDIGSTTRIALEALRSGVPPTHSGPAGERNQSNGALMRILPVALVDPVATPARLAQGAAASSMITHGHPLCLAASALHVLAARNLLGNARRGTAAEGAAGALSAARHELRALARTGSLGFGAATLDALEGWPGREGRGHVADSLWSAWGAFASSGSYAETIERAVRLGHDTDTTAAIAGGIAGLWWGLPGIPAEWLGLMRGREVVEPLVARLLAAWGA